MELREKCPNCIEQNKDIPRMKDGSCGVCAGTGSIVWKETGFKVKLSQ